MFLTEQGEAVDEAVGQGKGKEGAGALVWFEAMVTYL